MRVLSSITIGLALCGMAAPVRAARSLRVHGAARIDGHAGRSHGRILLEGRVLDDAGSPVPSANLATTFAPSVDLAGVTACGEERPLGALRSDESGRFCFWIPATMGAYTVDVTAGATQWLTAGTAHYAIDLSKRSVELRFDPEPRIVSLDGAESALDVVATSDDEDPAHAGASSLPLTLVTERGVVLAHATTGAGGRASFLFAAKDLGEPGRGALVVRFAGDEITMPGEHVAPIERDTRVTLTLAKDVEPSAPEDGVDLAVVAQLARGSSSPTGTVEARLDGTLVGAAALAAGRATVHATFVPPRGSKSVALQLRYVPDAPWFQPRADLAANVPIRGPSPLRQLPLAIGAIAIGAWLLLGRNARRQRLDRTVVMTRPPTHEGMAGIAVVHSSRSRTGVYRGHVVDAHDGAPVARARVSVQAPAFSSAAPPLASVFADDGGEFSLELEVAPPDAELVVEAPLHVDLRQKLPGAGVLEIALVSRRRKLLERLVQWAKRRGPPFDVRPEPTPAQVRRTAEGSMPAAAAWADAIEQAAFDQGDVDARVEAEVMKLEPTQNPRR